ncbi:MAG: DUF1828 domain-containing protein [Burkholderiaceae bacterium]|nr:DUF1828 domain-containing protein [Burkholderiaceae bacterium]
MTNRTDCRGLVSSYLTLLGAGFTADAYDADGCRIVTPFWRNDGDHLELFVVPSSDNRVLISDEGQTVEWLYSIGLDIETSDARQESLEKIAHSYGAILRNGTLRIETDSERTVESIHLFLQVLLAASQMTAQRVQRAAKTFRDEVENFLIENQQQYRAGYPVTGKSTEHRIDFYLNSSRNILVETISASSTSSARDRALKVAFEWIDIREGGWDYLRVALIDDSDDKWEQVWQNERLRAPLESYSDRVIYWSQKAKLLPLSK